MMRWVVIIIAFLPGMFAVASETWGEERLKAGFIGNFVQFTRWPGSPARISICGLEAHQDADPLAHLGSADRNSLAVVVRRVKSVHDLNGCQVFYLDSSNAARLPNLLVAAGKRPVLVITEFDGGVPLGAALSLVFTGGGRLGFDVNLTAARAAGLDINARLLQLARRVY